MYRSIILPVFKYGSKTLALTWKEESWKHETKCAEDKFWI
jgi:hypothetical protein